MTDYDAIVIGAGPAGGSAAFFLARAGMRVAVVERAEYPRRKVCGEFVSATTMPILDAIGIGAAARAGGGPPVSRVGVYGSQATVTAPMPRLAGLAGAGQTIPRDVLDPLLLEAARSHGATVYQPWKAVSVETVGDRRALTIVSGDETRTLVAPILIAAHGSWEPGGLPTQLPKSNRPNDLLAFKAYYHGATFDTDLIALVGIPGGYGGMVHRDEATLGFSVCIRRDLVARCREEFLAATAGESVLRYAAHASRGIGEALAGATFERAPMAAGPIRPGIRGGYRDGIFRVGNAAGEAHPAIAEGISIAIQSGVLLSNHLAAGGSIEERGRAYDAAWRAQFGGRLRAAELYARACMSPTADRVFAPILTRLPGLLTAAAVLSGKTRSVEPNLRWLEG